MKARIPPAAAELAVPQLYDVACGNNLLVATVATGNIVRMRGYKPRRARPRKANTFNFKNDKSKFLTG